MSGKRFLSEKLLRGLTILTAILFIGAVSAVARNVNNPDTVVKETYYNISTLDPAYAIDVASYEALEQFYGNLIQYDATSVKRFLPMLSTNVPSVADGTLLDNGTTYVFHIRRGVYFHNGDLLTPEDVVYSLERTVIFDRAGGPSWMLSEPLLPMIDNAYTDSLKQWAVKYAGVKSWSDLFADGTKTPKNEKYRQALLDAFSLLSKAFEVKGNDVIVHLPHPYSPFLYTLAHGSVLSSILDKKWAVSKGAWPGTADTWWKYNDPARENDPLYSIENGTGPFYLKRWDKGREIVFERFGKYWQGPAKIKYGIIKYVAEFTTRKLDLIKGNADVIEVPVSYLSQVENLDNVTVEKGLPTFSVDSIFFTWNIDPKGNNYVGSGKLDGKGIPPDFFSNKDVRMAFEYLFPYREFISQVWLDQALRLNGAIPSGMLGNDPTDPEPFSQNLEKAAYYFKKAYGGELWKKGFSFTAVYNAGNSQRQTALEMIRHFAAKVNPKFDVKVSSELWATFLSDLTTHKLPKYMVGWTASYPDTNVFAKPFYSSAGTFGGFLGKSYAEWAHENLDPLLVESMKTVNAEDRAALYKKMNGLVHDNAVYLLTDQQMGIEVQRSWLKGWYYNPMNYLRLNFYPLYK